MISFGRRRAVVPPSSEGDGAVAQRHVAQAAVKPAEKARNAVLVDGWRCRVWARNPRGSIKCPCSSEAARPPVDSTLDPSADFVIPRYEGDDERWADSGSADPEHESSSSSPVDASYPAKSVNEEQVEYLERLLLGEGSRCAICFGTGFIDGYRLWGGERLVMCSAVDSPGVTLVDGTAVPITPSAGSNICTDRPPSFDGVAEIVPSCASAIARQIERPRPDPPYWRERDGSAR